MTPWLAKSKQQDGGKHLFFKSFPGISLYDVTEAKKITKQSLKTCKGI